MSIRVSFEFEDGRDAQLLIALYHALSDKSELDTVATKLLPDALHYLADRLMYNMSYILTDYGNYEWREMYRAGEKFMNMQESYKRKISA